LSRFLLLFLHLRQISNASKPGYAPLHVIKILYNNYFLASIKLSSRHCASAHLQTFCKRDNLSVTYQNCTATLVMLNKICTMTAKTRAIPSLHHDHFSAKAPGQWPVLTSGNATSPYCRAVRFHSPYRSDNLLYSQDNDQINLAVSQDCRKPPTCLA
jgi:hypothetical protein